MSYRSVMTKLKTPALNRNGFTFLMAIFMVMIIGILSAQTGKSWTMIMKREREKELIFRGSQIKEAIENWYNPKYTVLGVKWQGLPRPLMELKDLLKNPYTLEALHYLPHSYGTKLEGENSKCAPDCAEYRVTQDPITGKEWTVIRGTVAADGTVTPNPGGGIIGVASKSDETPLKTDFKDTALENMVVTGDKFKDPDPMKTATEPKDGGAKTTRYSDWKFVADPKNDHTKIYRAYHESW
ncbi:MAG: hypothetical protein A2X85_12055 [Geobacteraceae bacterium GWF2_54_21]|nr:MAG: hypothetical protein A2X85_12055 [Geobacteraceae bacterium GWF2_54_21]